MLDPITQHPLPVAPAWAIDAGYLGRAFILLALLGFLTSITCWALALKRPALEKWGKRAFILGGCCLFATIICLGSLFANNQFEYKYVFDHGDVNTELKYKIAGIWSGQQGSFLLWACTSSIFGLLASRFTGLYRRWFTIAFSVFLASLCGILAYETPFELAPLIHGQILVLPFGAGLTPSLQNYWVIIHPPTIFMGFGSLTVAFALGISAMLSRNAKDWIPILRPWVILSTSILGLGLSMGGFWAYETLGWGGFWMWDPVENVSFVPWIFSIALLHGLIVQASRNRWVGGNLILAGLPFITFCYGTFLTRSGFLADASVHSFTEMNRAALWILAGFVVLAAAVYYTIYGTIGTKLAKTNPVAPHTEKGVDREGFYTSGVLLLSGLAVAVAVGMSVPFYLSLAHRPSKVVEEPLYHQVVVWFFVPIMVLMGIAPFVGWRKMGWKAVLDKLVNVLALTIGGLGLILLAIKASPAIIQPPKGATVAFPKQLTFPLVPWIMILVSVCLFCFVANLFRIVETFKRAKMSIGGFVAHMGVATLLAGLIISRGLQKEDQVILQEGDEVTSMGYTISYQGMTHPEEGGLLLRDNKVKFMVSGPNGAFEARPGLYFIPQNDGQIQTIVWPHVEHMGTHDLYFELGQPQNDVWQEPPSFKPGETRAPSTSDEKKPGPITLTYNGFKMEGKGGGVGTKFVTDFIVQIKGNDGNVTEHEVHPELEVSSSGPVHDAVPIDSEFSISLERLDAADHSASVQVHFNHTIYYIQIYYKPMVILVWLGAGITFLGGALAAYSRRPRAKTAPSDREMAS